MDRIENWKGKTVMVVTPHPDDDMFGCGGTLIKLARNGNKIIIVIYTSDNAGSEDETMTKEKLAAIRHREEESSCAAMGIPKENIVWFNYDDGMLEYVDKRELTKQVAREIRKYKPDAIFSIDPGKVYKQWHKSDHNTAAFLTVDAMRAAGWRLYFPELEKEGFKAWTTPVCYFYYSTDPNYRVNISDVIDTKISAALAHTSQFPSMVKEYREKISDSERKKLIKEMPEEFMAERKGSKFYEKFRRDEGYGQ